jgi:serine/threonine protein phosphatase 1
MAPFSKLSKFFRKAATVTATVRPFDTARIPDGQRVYAIGDVHGRNDLLLNLLAQIGADDQRRGLAETQIILLGDLIDRGPSSAQVIDTAIELKRAWPNTRFLMGNHEEMFLQVCREPTDELVRNFVRSKVGGEATFMSYPITRSEYLALDIAGLAERLGSLIPEAHLAFVESFEDQIIIGDYAFVHAGIMPGQPLSEQSPKHLRWIREEFLNYRGDFEKVIIYGHTISANVDESGSRIGIDTGAYNSGKLTAIGLEGGQRWYLDTSGDS